MRRAPTLTLTAVALLALAAPRAVLAGAPRKAVPRAAPRTRRLDLEPVPNDLALAEIRFPRAARRQHLTSGSLKVAVRGAFGDDYLALATPRADPPGGTAQALLLIVNRPSPLLDPDRVRLALSTRRPLRGPTATLRAEDPFTRPTSGTAPSLCDLGGNGAPLRAADLLVARTAGAPLGDLEAAAAVAQAYDAVCDLPYEASFRQLVTGVAPQPAPSPPAPIPTPPVGPAPPTPPTPGPPQCAPCDPPPAYACPDYCVAQSPLARPAGRRGY